jgi:hypothetical protein
MADVPSNLIPTRITQLPEAPVASEDSLLLIVYQGNNYKIRAGDILQVAGVPTSRQVIAGTGLTGGGQLSSNVTLSIAPGGVGSTQLANSGVTPGTYGSSTLVPVFTVDSTGRVTAATTVAVDGGGGVPLSREVIAGVGLNGGGALNANVTLNANLSNATPLPVDTAGAAGVSNNIARADHQHPAIDLSDDDQVDNILGLGNGGTARSLVMSPGAIIWSGADGLYVSAPGVSGQVLVSGGTSAPTWASAATDAPQPAHVVYIGPTSGGDAPPTFRLLISDDLPTAITGKTITNSTIDNSIIGGVTPAAGNFTTVDATDVEVTNIKAKDGTASASIADATGVMTINSSVLGTTDINGGTIDATVIGGTTPAAGNFTTVDTTNLEVSNLKARDGTAAGTVANSTGVVTLNSSVLTTTDINGGTIDGTTIGASTPSTGVFTTVDALDVSASLVDTTNLEVSNLKAKDGTAAGTIADTTGVVTLNSAVLTTADINGGTIDGTAIGASVASTGVFTQVDVDNLRLDGNTLSSTDSNGNIVLSPNGSGDVQLDADTVRVGDSGATATITSNGAGNIVINTNGGTDSGSITIANGVDGNITLDPNGTGEVAIPAGIDGPLYIEFNTTQSPLPSDATGRVYYDSSDQFQTLVFQMNGSVVQHIGEEQFFRIKCSGSITKGQVVMFAGTLGASGGLIGAAATGLSPTQANYILGIADESGSNNDWIFVTQFGEVKKINTTGGAESWAQGDVLYYNPAVTGGLTKTKPSAPNAIVTVAAVVHVGTSNGILFVRPTFGTVLGGTDGNVQFSTLNNDDLIQYYSAGQYWRNVAASSVTVGSATTATNLAGGAAGSIAYQTGASTTAMLAAGSGVLVGGSTPSYSTAPSLTGTNFTSIPNGALQNSSITIGTTGISLGGSSLTLGGLTSVAVTQDPTTALQLTTKQYVDALIASGVHYHTPVKYEVPNSTGNLNATYNNGTSGVGATLTNAGTLAAFTPDGVVALVGDRILIYNQTNQFENGIYEVTTIGDGAIPWVLTRTSDADTYVINSAAGLSEGSTVFVQAGATGAGETYVCNTSGVITFGTTAITFAQISSAQVYSAGAGLTLTGTQFSLTSPVVTSLGGTGLSSYTGGDLLYYSTGTALSKLGIAASTYMLTSSGSAPQWSDPAGVTVGNATNAVNATSATSATTATNVAGGTAGALVYNTGAGATTFLSLGTQDYVLVAGASAPTYVAQSTLSVGSATTATTATTANSLAGGAANQLVYQTGAGATSFAVAPTVASTFLQWSGSAFQWSTAVTSVGLSLPAEFTVTNSPVTGSGTLTGAWANQTANYVFAGPTTGSATTPTFRALVNADIPSALTGKTYDGLTLTANATGFSIAGGTTSKTLTVNNSITLAGTDSTTITLPATSGTVALDNQQFYIGTTQVAINRTSGSLSLTGVNIDGSAGSATNATNVGITDDTTTNATMYPVWVTANTGNLPAKVTSTKLSFNPSTGVLTATGGVSGGTF